MPRPSVTVAVSNNNLNIQAPSELGTSVLLVASPVAPVAGYGTAFMVRNKAQVATAFAQIGNAPVVAAINTGFYAEAPEGTKLYILAMAQTTTLATLYAEANASKPLSMASGAARLVAAVKFPANNYVPTVVEGFDGDVHTAVTAAHTLAATYFGLRRPFRFIVEGFAFVSATEAKDYASSSKSSGSIVVGSIDNSTATATLLALGRLAKIGPQQNIGRIKTGSLGIAETATVKIGTVTMEEISVADLDELWEKRYITFERNEAGSGYVFNDDNTLTVVTDDFNNLRYGRVMDNAVRVAYATYYNELKDDVDVDDNGRLDAVVEKALENAIEGAIDTAMRQQLSKKPDGSANVTCLVNPDPVEYAALYSANEISSPNFNILETNQVYIFLQIKPKGCLKFLNVYLGFSA